ncbi:mechanosensitive ion channel family protein [Candidatus Micrarchaeota archaeon]|nr:mechanosensitive ion channel family protein [Candidatus Micrarchaeota archaeon]
MQEYISIIISYLDNYSYLTGGNKLLFSLVILLASFISAWIIAFFLKELFARVAKKTKSEFDDKLLEALERPVFRLIVLAGVMLSLQYVGLSESVIQTTNQLFATAFILILVFLGLDVSNVFYEYGVKKIAAKTESSLDDEIIPIAQRTTGVVIWIFGIIFILGIWGIDVTPVIAGLGIAGLALSFAVKDSLANIFGGISIILDRTFKVGDKVSLDSGEIGTIADVGLRSTRLRTYDNEIIIIPNAILANSKIKNYVQPDTSVRVVVDFGVEYGSDPEKVKKVILETISKISGISKEPVPQVLFTEMGDSALKFSARFWIPDYNEAYSKKIEAVQLIHDTLKKSKIGIPFPTTTVYLKK